EEAADDADDANVFAQVWNFRAQTTDAAHDQIDFHPGAGSFVEFLDNLLIDERVELYDNVPGLSGHRVIAFALDHADDPFAYVERGDEQLFHAVITRKPVQRVEHYRDLLGDFFMWRE